MLCGTVVNTILTMKLNVYSMVRAGIYNRKF